MYNKNNKRRGRPLKKIAMKCLNRRKDNIDEAPLRLVCPKSRVRVKISNSKILEWLIFRI